MTTPIIKMKIFPKPIIKGKMDVRFPAKVEVENFLTVTRANGVYTFGIDYTQLADAPIIDPSTAMLVVLDKTAGIYKLQSVADIATDLPPNSVTYGQIQQVGANKLLGNPTGSAANVSEIPIGTGVATALGDNVGSAGAVVVNGGVLGTPSSGTATNLTGLPISTGVSGLATGMATFLATPSSANLRAALTDEVGTGAAYFIGGALGTPTSGTATNLTGLPISTGVAGLGTGIATFLATPSSSNLAATITDETGSGALVFATSPTLVTPALGTPSSGVATNLTGTASGLTAGHVTTNANMTGDVTSVGNTTTLATGNAGNLNSGTLLAARMPALTGDVTTTAGTVATTITANAVTNSKLATAGAATLKGNPTNATANVTDFTIQGLTARGAPDAANDKIPIYDNAAGTIKYVTPSQVAGASSGTVTSVATAGIATGGPFTTSGTVTVTAAVQADQETSTSNTVAVTPGVQQYHPSAAKAWAKVTQTGTQALNASYNMSSVTDTGAGKSQFNLTVPFSSANYAMTGSAVQLVSNVEIWTSLSQATGNFAFFNNNSGTGSDTIGQVTAFGDQ